MIRADALAERAAILVLLGLFSAGPLRAEVLITEREAKLPNDDITSRGAFPGPKVVVVSPARGSGVVKSPFNLEIRFESRDGVKIDLDTLSVTYKKSPPVDLTERVRDFLTPQGIEMPLAEAPPGDHKIQIEIKDVDGRPGGTEFSIDTAK
jgi:hypothetical protein